METLFVDTIIDTMPMGILVFNREGIIVRLNEYTCTLLGMPVEQLTGRGWGEIFFDDERNDAFNQVIIDVIEEKRTNMHREVLYYPPGGAPRSLFVTTSFLTDGGALAGIVVILDDITEVNRLLEIERCLRRENEELQKKQIEELSKLSLSVAHVIRNPVVSIGGFAKLLSRKTGETPEYREYCDIIIEGTRRLEHIVTAVREYTEIRKQEDKPFNVRDPVDEARNRIESEAAGKGTRCVWNVEIPDTAIVVGDRHLFGDALCEVFRNAVGSFRNGEGTITVGCRQTTDICEIDVVDTGCGIPRGDLPLVFDPFFTTGTENIGMGLFKVRKIIHTMRGSIAIAQGDHRGTKVTFSLPVRSRSALPVQGKGQ